MYWIVVLCCLLAEEENNLFNSDGWMDDFNMYDPFVEFINSVLEVVAIVVIV